MGSIRAMQSAVSDLLDNSESCPSPLLGLLFPGPSIHRESSHETSDGKSDCCGACRRYRQCCGCWRSIQPDGPAASGPQIPSVATVDTGCRPACCRRSDEQRPSQLLVRTGRSRYSRRGVLLQNELRLQCGCRTGKGFRWHGQEFLVRTGSCGGSCSPGQHAAFSESCGRTALEEAASWGSLIVLQAAGTRRCTEIHSHTAEELGSGEWVLARADRWFLPVGTSAR